MLPETPALAHSLIIGGVGYPLWNAPGEPTQVRRWNDGLLPVVPEFKAGDGYNKRRVKPIDLMVWHWTGGEQDPISMAETLRKRELGIEVSIDCCTGIVYQFCDPLVVDTADAGIVNSRSMGCEIVCYGYRSVWELKHAMGVPKLGRDRPTYEAVTHGRAVKTAQFYPAQMRAAIAVANAVSTAIPAIRRRVPVYNAGALYPKDLRAFTGHIGHFHITDKKRDPGPWFMDQLRADFEAQTPQELV